VDCCRWWQTTVDTGEGHSPQLILHHLSCAVWLLARPVAPEKKTTDRRQQQTADSRPQTTGSEQQAGAGRQQTFCPAAALGCATLGCCLAPGSEPNCWYQLVGARALAPCPSSRAGQGLSTRGTNKRAKLAPSTPHCTFRCLDAIIAHPLPLPPTGTTRPPASPTRLLVQAVASRPARCSIASLSSSTPTAAIFRRPPFRARGPPCLLDSPSAMPEPPATNSFLEQTVSLMSSTASYMRLPAIASTVCPDTSASPAQCLNGCAVNRADWLRGQVFGSFFSLTFTPSTRASSRDRGWDQEPLANSFACLSRESPRS